MWRCVTCGEAVEGQFDACWSCGTSRDGALAPDFEPAPGAREDSAHRDEGHEEADPNPVECPRCRRPLDFIGSKAFHEGRRWGLLGELGQLFVNRERFDVYCCSRCGRVEFFVAGIGEDLRSP
jgi:hypothetical protein